MKSRSLTLAGVLVLACALSGCGFRPLYANYGPNAGAQVLGSVYVEPIEGEIAGYELRNALIDGLHAPVRSQDAAYRLSIDIRQTIQPIVVENNANISRFNYLLEGTYKLTDAKGAIEKQGIENTLSAYDVVESPYATLAAQHDAQRRSAKDLAYRIQVEIAVFLAHRSTR